MAGAEGMSPVIFFGYFTHPVIVLFISIRSLNYFYFFVTDLFLQSIILHPSLTVFVLMVFLANAKMALKGLPSLASAKTTSNVAKV